MTDGLLDFIPTHPEVPHPLGRSVVHHDPRNRAFRALDRPPAVAAPRAWYVRHVFAQQGSSCTMQAAAGIAFSSPFRLKLRPVLRAYDTEEERHAGYLRAQAYDPWEGGEPAYEGSSTDAPYKLMREEGLIGGWDWYFGTDELGQGVRRNGPASVGTVWLWSMFKVDSRGFVIIDPSSGGAGGHAYEVIWYDPSDDEFVILNSWGRGWGNSGRAKIKGADMRYLLEERQGEACTIRL